jgi:hypothetical protein
MGVKKSDVPIRFSIIQEQNEVRICLKLHDTSSCERNVIFYALQNDRSTLYQIH